MYQSQKCDGCREIYARRNPPQDPPCEICRELPEQENEDAERIFFLVRDQFIMGMNGPISISHEAIHEAMRLYRIKNRRDCFEKVLILSRWWIEKIREKNEG
jgi:hypothetical protein